MKYYRSLGAPTTILLQDFATQLVEHSYGNFPCEGGGLTIPITLFQLHGQLKWKKKYGQIRR